MCWSYLENEVVIRSTLINNQVITFKEVKVFNMIKLYGKPIRVIKSVNDVLVGTIFYGARLYMQNAEKGSSNAHSTALVLLNTRVIKTYKKLNEMVKPDAESLWGNQFGFLHIPVPKSDDVEIADPLEFVYKAKETIKNKRGSLAVFLTGTLIEFI